MLNQNSMSKYKMSKTTIAGVTKIHGNPQLADRLSRSAHFEVVSAKISRQRSL